MTFYTDTGYYSNFVSALSRKMDVFAFIGHSKNDPAQPELGAFAMELGERFDPPEYKWIVKKFPPGQNQLKPSVPDDFLALVESIPSIPGVLLPPVVFLGQCWPGTIIESLWDTHEDTLDRTLVLPDVAPTELVKLNFATVGLEGFLRTYANKPPVNSAFSAVFGANTKLASTPDAESPAHEMISLRYVTVGGSGGLNVRRR